MYIFLVLQNVVTLSVNLADNMMLGFYGETALSGVTAVNQIQFFFQQITMALGEGVVILGGQYWGKREPGSAKQVLAASLRWALVLTVLLFCIVSLFPEQTVGIFTEDKGIRAEGAEYLKVIRFSYLFFAVTQIFLAALRSVKVMKIAFYLSIMTFFVNCGLNGLFIFGNFGAPEMGAKGAAIGTLIARVLETAVLAGYFFRRGGSTSYTMVLDLISIWGIVVPLSFFMAFVVKAPAPVVVCCLNADQIFKCIPAFWKVNYGHWIRRLTRSVQC